VRWLGANTYDALGDSGRLAIAGDLDGDGRGEILVASANTDTSGLTNIGEVYLLVSGDRAAWVGGDPAGDAALVIRGALYAWAGGPDLVDRVTARDARVIWGGALPLETAGSELDVSDVDGDGALDLLAASPWFGDRGRGYALSGAAAAGWGGGDPADDASAWFVGADAGDGLGSSVTGSALSSAALTRLLFFSRHAANSLSSIPMVHSVVRKRTSLSAVSAHRLPG
jgi:hypothetical protein